MPLGVMDVGLGPRHIVLDGDPASPSKKGAELPIFGPYLLWPNGWWDQDTTWYRGRPRSRRYCVRRGPSSPPENGHSPLLFGPCLLWQTGWMDQDATWCEGRLRPRPHCVTWKSSSPKRGIEFSAHVTSIVAKRSPISATAEHLPY